MKKCTHFVGMEIAVCNKMQPWSLSGFWQQSSTKLVRHCDMRSYTRARMMLFRFASHSYMDPLGRKENNSAHQTWRNVIQHSELYWMKPNWFPEIQLSLVKIECQCHHLASNWWYTLLRPIVMVTDLNKDCHLPYVRGDRSWSSPSLGTTSFVVIHDE